MLIPIQTLSDEALINIVDAFVLQEGTDYGHRDFALIEKRERVIASLRRGESVISFDVDSESVTIVPVEGR